MHLSYLNIAEIFGISEILLLLVKRSRSSNSKNQSDSGSLLTLWVVITLGIAISFYATFNQLGQLPRTNFTVDLSIAIALMGFIIRWTAIVQLGKMFTVDVAITSGHQLKTDGLYKLVRHPSYLGLLLIIWSIAICENNIIGYLVIIIPSFAALNYRIKVEEKVIVNEFGAQYEEYKKSTPRLIPWIY